MTYNSYKDEHSDIMNAFFKGKINIESLSSRPEPKKVELGYGKGIGHTHGSYDQYIEKLSEQTSKGNGIVSIGKSIKIDKDMPSMSNPTDKFFVGDIPYVLIMFYNVINPTSIKVLWKDSEDDAISEQYYEIESAHSMNYDWWDQYGIYFIGPEDLEHGNYKVEITSAEFSTRGKKKTLSTSLEFTVEEKDDRPKPS